VRRNADRWNSEQNLVASGGGLVLTDDGLLTINLSDIPGLEFDGGAVQVKVQGDGGLILDANGLQADPDVPRWRKYTVEHDDLQTGGTTNHVELFQLPAGGVISGVKLKHSEAFAGSGITGYTVTVGVTGELDRYSAPFNVLQAVGDAVHLTERTIGAEDHAAAKSIRLAATSVGGNLNQSSAGSLDVWVLWGIAVD
jgi:hypothetical protein